MCGISLRLFHWALFVSIIGAIISAKAGVLWVHERFGLTVLGLIIFRIVWGFVGGHYARFRQFLPCREWRFKSCKHYLDLHQNQSQNRILRQKLVTVRLAVAVLGLLGIPLFMAISGTMSNDDVLFDGPLHIW